MGNSATTFAEVGEIWTFRDSTKFIFQTIRVQITWQLEAEISPGLCDSRHPEERRSGFTSIIKTPER